MVHRMKCLFWAFVMLVLLSTSYSELPSAVSTRGAVKAECVENEYQHEKGFCCDKCHPGFRLVSECLGPNSRSKCQKCPEGTYIENANYNRNCFRCQSCRVNSEEISSCTSKSNTVCRCKSGYYKKITSSFKWDCSRCRECGSGQQKTAECAGVNNTQCACLENYYSINKTACKPCDGCREECKHLCLSPSISPSTKRVSDVLSKILVPVGACVMVLAVGVFMLYEGIRLWKKKNRALSSQSSESEPEPEKKILITSPDTNNENESSLFTKQPCEVKQNRELPDCVPREIKTHEFFYFVLEEVPIGRFKELARRLGVSEQNIDRAEQDHRTYKEAQYSILTVWSDGASGYGNSVLPNHSIQTFVDTMRAMNLTACAEKIEKEYLSLESAKPFEWDRENSVSLSLDSIS